MEIKVSEILLALQQGVTREEIKEKYSLSNKEMKVLFSHPKLKQKKTHKKPSFILVDDTEEDKGTELPFPTEEEEALITVLEPERILHPERAAMSEEVSEAVNPVWGVVQDVEENQSESIAESQENTNFEEPIFNN